MDITNLTHKERSNLMDLSEDLLARYYLHGYFTSRYNSHHFPGPITHPDYTRAYEMGYLDGIGDKPWWVTTNLSPSLMLKGLQTP